MESKSNNRTKLVQKLDDGTLILRNANRPVAAITPDGAVYESNCKSTSACRAKFYKFWSHFAPDTFVSSPVAPDFFAGLVAEDKKSR